MDELLDQFQSRLGDSTVTPEPTGPTATAPATPTFRSIGVRVITARLKELRAAGPHIFFPSENKELHELRILAKGLRYATELFAACWGEDMRAIAREVALLQTSLGDLHECDVWSQELV